MPNCLRPLANGALAGVLALSLIEGCAHPGDVISVAEQADKNPGVAIPGIEETRAIAEDGFTYGFPSC